MGLTSIVLLLILTMTEMYLFPCCDRVCNFPVCLENTVFLTAHNLVYTSFILRPHRVGVFFTNRGVRLGLADLTFFLD